MTKMYTGRKIRVAGMEPQIIQDNVAHKVSDVNVSARQELTTSIEDLLYNHKAHKLIRVFGKNAPELVDEVLEDNKSKLESRKVTILPKIYFMSNLKNRFGAEMISRLGKDISYKDSLTLNMQGGSISEYIAWHDGHIIWHVQLLEGCESTFATELLTMIVHNPIIVIVSHEKTWEPPFADDSFAFYDYTNFTTSKCIEIF